MPKKEKKAAKPQRKKAGKKAKPAAKKKDVARRRATAATPARVLTRRRGQTTEVVGLIDSVTSEEIALKAYYLGERRRHLGLPGNAESDWLEAERQLRS